VPGTSRKRRLSATGSVRRSRAGSATGWAGS
jgi:hypothetical protein